MTSRKRSSVPSSSSTNVVARAKKESAAKRARSPGPRGRSRSWEIARSILGALAIYLVIRTFFVEAFRIPSESMEPTLLVGDFLFVNKLIYGPRIPFTSIALPGYADPQRGEVVVYTSPDDRDGNPTVVKRLVGVSGDTLYMRDGLLHVNGMVQRQSFATPGADVMTANATHPDFEWQNRFVLRQSRFGPAPRVPTHDNWGPFLIPPRHYFGLGDNRYNSKDSRYYGFVPRENFSGRPIFIYFSVDWDAWRIRGSRIGDRVK
ncbi:MAG: signal peptidase I [Gemmatimonadaceae bacterium]